MTQSLDQAMLDQAFTLAVDLAQEAGAILRDRLLDVRSVEMKGSVDLVTDADRASETLISTGLRSTFPDHRMTGEEGSVGADLPVDEQPWGWTFDPLDGTTNYAHRYPHFAVSICLEYRHEPVMGVVYDPMRNELFAARQGQGATLNGTPIAVTACEDLRSALLASGFSYDINDRPRQFREWEVLNNAARGVRRDGAAALDMCWVAAGRLDGYWERPVCSWDVGAGSIIVREAGGLVTAIDGSPYDLYGHEIMATNPRLHTRLSEAVVAASVIRTS